MAHRAERPPDLRHRLANQKLDAAGYVKNADGNRLDKQGKPINLRLVYPSDSNGSSDYAKDAQFIKDWFGQLGIKVTVQKSSTATL